MRNIKLYYGFYDFANSAYGLVLQNYLLPTYFSVVLINYGLTLGSWGLANGIGTVIGVILGIVLGKYSDKKGDKIKIFTFLVIMSFLSSLALGYVVYSNPKMVFYMYIIANGFFIPSMSMYNSLLGNLSDKNNSHEFSGFAWGFGYAGGIIGLIIIMILQKFFGNYSPFIFIFISLFYIIFSLISVFGIKESVLNNNEVIQVEKKISISNKSKIKLLFGYWLISECITVILLFFGTYVTGELKLSITIAGACMILVQLIGLPSTIYGSKLFKKIGEKKSMNIMVVIWFMAILSLISGLGYIGLIVTLILGGLVIGNSQSLMRSEYSNLIDVNKSGFEFGIFGFITQIGSFIGPIMYGYMSDGLGSQKIPLLIFGIFMIIGVGFINHADIYKNTGGILNN